MLGCGFENKIYNKEDVSIIQDTPYYIKQVILQKQGWPSVFYPDAKKKKVGPHQ